MVREQPMDAGDADVVQARDAVARQLGRQRRFLGDRQVGRAGSNHQDLSAADDRRRRVNDRRTRACAEYDRLGNAARNRAAGSGSRRVISTLWPIVEAARDLDDLFRRLACAENHFGKAGAQGAVMIDLGEAEVVERQRAQLIERGIGAERAGAHLAQQVFQALGVHTRK